MKAQVKNGRLVQLDILRGIAILLVLGCHFAVYVPFKSAGVLQGFSDGIARFGWAGVDLFFVLSGFLVGGLLFHEARTRGSLDVRRFMIRRGFKIWPLYFVYLAIMMLRHTATHNFSFAAAWQTWWPNVLHIQNYVLESPRRHLWSLAVEEHFYLALPLLLLLVVAWRRSEKKTEQPAALSLEFVPFLAFTIMALCLLGRLWACLKSPTLSENPNTNTIWWVYSATHLRIDSLIFGVLLAYWHHYKPEKLAFATRHALLLLLASAVLIAPMIFIPRNDGLFVSTLGYSMLYLGFGAMLLAFVYTPIDSKTVLARCLNSGVARIIAFIGLFSYPIYLWHYDASTLVVQKLAEKGLLASLPIETRWMILAAVHLALATLCGIFWARVLEKPSLALRDRTFPGRAVALPDADTASDGATSPTEELRARPALSDMSVSQ